MTKRYKFDFSKMTILDMHILASGDVMGMGRVVDKVTIGGAMSQPISEFGNLLAQFHAALMVHAGSNQPVAEDADDDAVRAMLDGIDGLD